MIARGCNMQLAKFLARTATSYGSRYGCRVWNRSLPTLTAVRHFATTEPGPKAGDSKAEQSSQQQPDFTQEQQQRDELPPPPPTPKTVKRKGYFSRRQKIIFLIALGGLVLRIAYNFFKEDEFYYAEDDYNVNEKSTTKPRIVILGSGWAALSMVMSLDTDQYDVVVISPRNYFLFTPLLPSVTVGTLETRSITEPIRKYCQRANAKIHYYEASCTDVDTTNNKVICKEATSVKSGVDTFEVKYDYLVVAVGAVNNTFGTPGVYENCCFLKEVEDARKIRRRILDCFEAASLAPQTESEQKRLLHFVVVGGGPNGVEFAAELNDFIYEDMRKYFPELVKHAKITIVELTDHILNTYDARISAYTEKHFKRNNIDMLVKARVTAVNEDAVVCMRTDTKEEVKLPFGLCVWSTGIGPSPLIDTVRNKFSQDVQNNRRALVTDEYLKLKGSDNIYALGDCATVTQERLLTKFVDLFNEHANESGVLTINEFHSFVKKYIHRYPQLEEIAKRVENAFEESDINKDGKLSEDEFKAMLTKLDAKLTMLPATAQVASQQGEYLAETFNKLSKLRKQAEESSEKHLVVEEPAPIRPFRYQHFGSFAYVGSDRAVADFSGKITLSGLGAWWLWRSVYLSKQISLRNKILVGFDWSKTLLFGRDISKA